MLWRLPSLSFPLLKVEVVYDDRRHVHDIVPRKLIVQGYTLFYKSSISVHDRKEGIIKLNILSTSSLSYQELRTPSLYGIVKSDFGKVRGLLYQWMEVHETLMWAVHPDTPVTTREKWAGQI